MAAPYQSAADAVGYIDELITAGPRADYEDEYGNHVNVGSCTLDPFADAAASDLTEGMPNAYRRGGQR